MNQLLTEFLARDHAAELRRASARRSAIADRAPMPPRRGPLASWFGALRLARRLAGIRAAAAAAARRSAWTHS